MTRKIKIEPADADKFGILVSYQDGASGWIVGPDCDYLLFDSDQEASRALRKLKRNDNYSWNCRAEVVRFSR